MIQKKMKNVENGEKWKLSGTAGILIFMIAMRVYSENPFGTRP